MTVDRGFWKTLIGCNLHVDDALSFAHQMLLRLVISGVFCCALRQYYGMAEVFSVGEVVNIDLLATLMGCKVRTLRSTHLGMPFWGLF